METTPHRWALELTEAQDEAYQLRAENAQLRALLIELLRAMKEIELTLRNALDKDRK